MSSILQGYCEFSFSISMQSYKLIWIIANVFLCFGLIDRNVDMNCDLYELFLNIFSGHQNVFFYENMNTHMHTHISYFFKDAIL